MYLILISKQAFCNMQDAVDRTDSTCKFLISSQANQSMPVQLAVSSFSSQSMHQLDKLEIKPSITIFI